MKAAAKLRTVQARTFKRRGQREPLTVSVRQRVVELVAAEPAPEGAEPADSDGEATPRAPPRRVTRTRTIEVDVADDATVGELHAAIERACGACAFQQRLQNSEARPLDDPAARLAAAGVTRERAVVHMPPPVALDAGLERAACMAETARVLRLLALGAEADGLSAAGDSLLGLCCFHCRALTVEELQALLEACPKAALAHRDRKGRLPLHALLGRHAPLTAAHVDCMVRAAPLAARALDDLGRAPLHHLVLMQRRVRVGELAAALEPWPEAAATPDRHGLFCLHLLCRARGEACKLRNGGASDGRRAAAAAAAATPPESNPRAAQRRRRQRARARAQERAIARADADEADARDEAEGRAARAPAVDDDAASDDDELDDADGKRLARNLPRLIGGLVAACPKAANLADHRYRARRSRTCRRPTRRTPRARPRWPRRSAAAAAGRCCRATRSGAGGGAARAARATARRRRAARRARRRRRGRRAPVARAPPLSPALARAARGRRAAGLARVRLAAGLAAGLARALRERRAAARASATGSAALRRRARARQHGPRPHRHGDVVRRRRERRRERDRRRVAARARASSRRASARPPRCRARRARGPRAGAARPSEKGLTDAERKARLRPPSPGKGLGFGTMGGRRRLGLAAVAARNRLWRNCGSSGVMRGGRRRHAARAGCVAMQSGHQATRSAGDPLTRGPRGSGVVRREMRRPLFGTEQEARFWLCTDCCGLTTAGISYAIILFSEQTVTSKIIGPWLKWGLFGVLNAIVFNGFATMAMLSHMRAMFTNPGAVPKARSPSSFARARFRAAARRRARVDARVFGARLHRARVSSLRRAQEAKPIASDAKRFAEERKRQFSPRSWCRKCEAYKPPRAHHDSVTNRCIVKVGGAPNSFDARAHSRERAPSSARRGARALVLASTARPMSRASSFTSRSPRALYLRAQLDHYCPWVNNAVGVRNHKFFLLFLFYVFFMCAHAALLITTFGVAVANDANRRMDAGGARGGLHSAAAARAAARRARAACRRSARRTSRARRPRRPRASRAAAGRRSCSARGCSSCSCARCCLGCSRRA